MSNFPLTAAQLRDFRCLASHIIPEDKDLAVPGADDEIIFSDIVRSLERDEADVANALDTLARLSDGSFADLAPERRIATIEAFQRSGGIPLAVLVRLVLVCYYRDDRVMISLGLEPRPPFPTGHQLPKSDWSLLDPVRARGPIYRSVTAKSDD